MSVRKETIDKRLADSGRRWDSSLRRVFLVGVLILCTTALGGYYQQGARAQISEPPGAGAGKLAAAPSVWPAKGMVTSGFGWRVSPFGDGNELHAGVDIAVNMGTPVVATADGQVVQSGPYGDYGNMVQIDHGDGIATVYGHNSLLAVSVGQTVQKGQVISYAGSTGKSTGPHVHYEVRKDGAAIDPWRYLVAY